MTTLAISQSCQSVVHQHPLGRILSRRSLLAWLVAAVSCSSARTAQDGGKRGLEGVDLPVVVSGAAKLAVGRQYVAIADNGASSPLRLYPKDGGEAGAVVLGGSDDPRYTWISSLQFRTDRRGEGLWVFDTRLGVLVRYALDGDHRLAIDTSYEVPVGGTPLGAYWLDDTLVIASGVFNEPRRFYLWSPSMKVPHAGGVLPYLTPETPVFPLQQALQPSVAMHPTDHMVAIAPLFAGRLDIYSIPRDTPITAQAPHAFEPELRVGMRGGRAQFIQGSYTRAGYLSVSATGAHIYALFSGLSRSAGTHGWLPGRVVDVFDWTGQFQRSIQLDRDALEIAIDPSESALYATVLQPSKAGRSKMAVRKYAITETRGAVEAALTPGETR
jgi:TolB-like 6-blade propeller-like